MIHNVTYTSHTRDIVVLSTYSVLCKSSNEKRSEIYIREQFVTRMVRCGGEIENGDFDKRKNANVRLFWYVFVVTISSHWSLEEFWREVPKFKIYSK